uniref:Uncharacterized protein n=1 Tax=Marseillevirus LCMAC102 TaxID=2506603 RepID=A0A481YV01_9VIRU|nr:MAG: hypothetical protein LCMAC102_01310 [Marseillevirus LCMAC102]
MDELEEDFFLGEEYETEESFGEEEEEVSYGPSSSPEIELDPGRFDPGRFEPGLPISRIQKIFRDPLEVTLDTLHGALASSAYEIFRKDIRTDAYRFVTKLPREKITLYNVDVLAPAAIFIVEYTKTGINKKNITEFIKKTSNLAEINHLDFIRYIRMLS